MDHSTAPATPIDALAEKDLLTEAQLCLTKASDALDEAAAYNSVPFTYFNTALRSTITALNLLILSHSQEGR